MGAVDLARRTRGPRVQVAGVCAAVGCAMVAVVLESRRWPHECRKRGVFVRGTQPGWRQSACCGSVGCVPHSRRPTAQPRGAPCSLTSRQPSWQLFIGCAARLLPLLFPPRIRPDQVVAGCHGIFHRRPARHRPPAPRASSQHFHTQVALELADAWGSHAAGWRARPPVTERSKTVNASSGLASEGVARALAAGELVAELAQACLSAESPQEDSASRARAADRVLALERFLGLCRGCLESATMLLPRCALLGSQLT